MLSHRLPSFLSVRHARLIAALACFGSVGCIGLHWDRQSINVVTQSAQNEARVLLIYQGLSALPESETGPRATGFDLNRLMQDRDAKSGLEAAQYDLRRFFHDRVSFALVSQLFRFDLKSTNYGGAAPNRWREDLIVLLRNHLSIPSGKIFIDDKGRLCGRQEIRIEALDAFLKALNHIISQEILKRIEREQLQILLPFKAVTLDSESTRYLQQAAMNEHAWVSIEPGRISLSVPGNARFFAKFKQAVLQNMRQRVTEQPLEQQQKQQTGSKMFSDFQIELQSLLTWLADNPLSWDERPDRLTISIGPGQGQPIQLYFGQEKTQVTKSEVKLVETVEKQIGELQRGVSSEDLMSRFCDGQAEVPAESSWNAFWDLGLLAVVLGGIGLGVWWSRRKVRPVG